LLTGATGFVGQSLIQLLGADSSFDIVGLSRSAYSGTQPPNYRHVQCDLNLEIPKIGEFDFVIHSATPASAELNHTDPIKMFNTNYKTMSRLLDFASDQSTVPTFLFTSSGAVYGALPSSLDSFPEDWGGGPSTLDVSSAYAEGKRAAEMLLTLATSRGTVNGLIARLFAFSGTNLPRDRHFAIGNFVRDVVQSRRIEVRGDGNALRSYLDERDMAEWLIAILKRGISGFAHHVGSDRVISIRDLAYLTADRYQKITGVSSEVVIHGQTSPFDGVSRYVPQTLETRKRLGVSQTISLEESLDSMIQAALLSAEVEN
jgi:nucleoside-diphosphate-sugar epimerase